MNLLIITHEFPPLVGGIGNASFNLAKQLVKQGVLVSVLTSSFSGERGASEIEGIKVHRCRPSKRRIGSFTYRELAEFLVASLLSSKRIANAERPDLVHAFCGVPAGAVALSLKRRLRIPYLVSLRGSDVPGYNTERFKLVHRVIKPLVRKVWSEASAMVVNSPGLGEIARMTMPELEVRVVPNGVDPDAFYPDPPARNRSPLKILAVSQLIPRKGIHHLLEAFALLAGSAGMEVELQIVGIGSYEAELRSLASKLGINEKVRFMGHVPYEDMPRIYRGADIMVHPSRMEGMPNSVLEAMSCGLPVTATDVPGNRDLVRDGENGFLVPFGDVKLLKERIHELLKDPSLREEMGRRSAAMADQFSWANISKRYIDCYGRILAGRGK